MSLVDLERPMSVIPERRRRQSPEIIDVDALDGDDIVYLRSSPARQRRRVAEDGRSVPSDREVIHIADSDDDQEIQFVGHNPARIPRPRPVRRDRIFSPPPPPQMGGIPPVPPIPQRFLPMRRRPPPFPTVPGLVIPNEQPFPFEADLRSAPRPVENPPAAIPPPAAARPSHHAPAMGFGGALLAGVRHVMRNRGEEFLEPHPARRNTWGFPGAVIMRWDPFDLFGAEEDYPVDDLDGLPFFADDDPPFGGVRHQLERMFERRDGHPSEPDYKPEYTHPNKPLPGFTHDFVPVSSSSPTSSVIVLDDSPGPSNASSGGSRSSDSALACALCHDPLILGASDIAEGREQRKLWGLRCGHLLDGRCIEKLMKPAPPVPQNPPQIDVKGKGKMIPETQDFLPSSCHDNPAEDQVADYNPMRSRLRPRRGMPGSFPSPSRSAQSSQSTAQSTVRRPTARSHAGYRGKGKGKANAPVVEAEHEWSCPVSGCGHVHLSLLVDGRWKNDEKRGAIAVFV
ncbi:hypothetical protein HYDPIDRAFT_113943 [Hydnomerulius pinastri MD-312]|uniref:Uncharacterized protein n=1 Tax=Hydnomerulius pinastri MD-312 TaxID=994086 RepID=A0A0C9WD92_9AGAM|nr:hypothetical protein HYDPIDRAFT_113943 [Hydnomerulius pinastri MD-312]